MVPMTQVYRDQSNSEYCDDAKGVSAWGLSSRC